MKKNSHISKPYFFNRNREKILVVGLCLALNAFVGSTSLAMAYEVWVTDQSDTAENSGGYLHVYDGVSLATDPAKTKPTMTLDLSQDINELCKKATGKAVRRPHMVFFTKDQSHAVLSFLTGQVLIMAATSKKPVACISVGANVHAAWPTPDQSMALAANIAEKKMIRVWTDYRTGSFNFDPAKDVLDLKALESGERPDNAPICPITESSSTHAFVTLRGGGLFVVNVKETPMTVVASLTDEEVHPSGCGGYQVGDTMYINSGGGWPVAPLAYDIYALDLATLSKGITAKLVSTRDTQFSDSHGLTAVGRYLWSVDRAGNTIEVIDTLSNLSVNSINLVGAFSDDPAPDLIDVSPQSDYVFVNMRGITPLTGNHPSVNNAKGSTPGVAVIKVNDEGRGGEVVGVARVSNNIGGKETADPHGIAVRKK